MVRFGFLLVWLVFFFPFFPSSAQLRYGGDAVRNGGQTQGWAQRTAHPSQVTSPPSLAARCFFKLKCMILSGRPAWSPSSMVHPAVMRLKVATAVLGELPLISGGSGVAEAQSHWQPACCRCCAQHCRCSRIRPFYCHPSEQHLVEHSSGFH